MLEKPSTPEKTMGNLPAQMTAAALAAGVSVISDTPFLTVLSSLIPVLFNSIPAQRHNQRLESWLQRINDDLTLCKDQLNGLSEAQYHVMTEAISAASQTISSHKLEYLRNAVKNSLMLTELQSQEASLLGRIVRDLSAQEAEFICKNFNNEFVFIGNEKSAVPKTLTVLQDSTESLVVRGLSSLGILETLGDSSQFGDDFGDGTYFKFSKITAKLIVLLR